MAVEVSGGPTWQAPRVRGFPLCRIHPKSDIICCVAVSTIAPATWRCAFQVMYKLLVFAVLVAFLLHKFAGLVPLNMEPHDHILIGSVSPDQLNAHLAAEARELQNSSSTPESTAETPGSAITGTGGMIISISPGLAALISALHGEILLEMGFLLFVSQTCQSLFLIRDLPPAITLASLDPPPRRNLRFSDSCLV